MNNDLRKRLLIIVADGIAVDAFTACEANFQFDLIAKFATEINEATFGQFFGSLQRTLGQSYLLALSRIFEPPNKRYLVRSIPSAISFLAEHKDTLKIEQPYWLQSFMSERGVTVDRQNSTNSVISYFQNKLTAVGANRNDLPDAIERLKHVRDKQLAHNEFIASKKVKPPTWAECDDLLLLALDFVAIVGGAYLTISYTDDRDKNYHSIEGDAKRTVTSLERMLKRIGINSDGSNFRPISVWPGAL